MSNARNFQLIPRNEGKACDAAVRSIEQRTGDGRHDIRWPERDHVGPPVELRLKIGTVEYAIEHTRIEPFENEIGGGVSLAQLFDPVKTALSGELFGPAFYTVLFPSNRKLVGKEPTLRQQQKNLEDWVRENALRLYGKLQGRIGNESDSEILSKDRQASIKATPCGFPYEIELLCLITGCLSWEKSGWIGAGRRAPNELEALRVCRLREALEKKLPKLQKCKSEGARTVLVLENRNIALTEPGVVGAVLARLHGEFTVRLPFPDEIYYVATYTEPWWVWRMKRDGKGLQGWSEPAEFRVAELIDLTG